MNVIRKIAKEENKRIATKRAPTVFNTLRNEKDKLKQSERTGVYKIPIRDVQLQREAAYLGVTSRAVHKRVEEHKKDIAQARLSTSLAQEAYSRDIEILWDQTKVVKPVPQHTLPTITESLEILRRKESENLINDRMAWEPSQAWKFAVAKALEQTAN